MKKVRFFETMIEVPDAATVQRHMFDEIVYRGYAIYSAHADGRTRHISDGFYRMSDDASALAYYNSIDEVIAEIDSLEENWRD